MRMSHYWPLAVFSAIALLLGCSDPTTVQGRVIDEQKYPVAGAMVSVAGEKVTATTNEAGGFTLEKVPMGERTITVSKPGYAAAEQEFTLNTKPVTQLGEAIRITSYSLSGKVSLGNSVKDHSGALVLLAGTDRTTLTDASGRFEFRGLPPDNYKVRVSKEGFSAIVFQVSTIDAPVYELPFSIQLPRLDKLPASHPRRK